MKKTVVSISFSQNEIWKVLDAIKAYKKDYEVSDSVKKLFENIEEKLKKNVS
jgi:sulfur relay (sulfurtransferase) DsrC/TusE family protein